MTRHFARAASLAALAIFCGCSKDTPVVGSYQLDTKHFAPHFADKLIEAGKIPEEARDIARSQLRSSVFNLEVKPDNTFSAVMRIGPERHTYTGNWVLAGSAFRLDQTHENGEEKEDTMTGRFRGDRLDLEQTEEGITVQVRLLRSAAAAPR